MREVNETYDICVCGGGLAGLSAAIAAARLGAKTVLVQDRPVLGGNSSSEIRVTPHGAAAFHAYARETGIISELLIEERARNHEVIFENGWTNSVYDMVLYDFVQNEPNLTLHLNTALQEVFTTPVNEGGALPQISHIKALVANAETWLTITAQTFIDCTGDGTLAYLAGCEWRMGSEGRNEFNEPHAPLQASKDTMGSSIHFKTKNVGRPVPFVAPDWAVKYEDASFFYEQGRLPKDERGGFWWLEIGVPWHTIYEAEDIRHELTRHALGVWDWMKNRDPLMKERTKNYALDWIGQVPGKRESRRIMGRYLMTEHDPQNRTVFPDEIAYGGWFIDLHTPGGLLAATSEPASAEGYKLNSEYQAKSYVGPYGIPLRILLAKDVSNLMMAGRNVSVTHVALGTVRVQATTALMGQAAGTAAALALQENLALHAVPDAPEAIFKVKQQLLRDGCFLPSNSNRDPADLASRANRITASSQALLSETIPNVPGAHEGLGTWTDQEPKPPSDFLLARRGQWLAIGGDKIESLSVCLANESGQAQTVEARLLLVDDIWDYAIDTARTVASTTLQVPAGSTPGEQQWVEWELNLKVTPGRYYRLDLLATPQVRWLVADAIVPGHVAAIEMTPNRMRRYGASLTCSFRISPPQNSYAPENVISGVTRPHTFTNLWRSDPNVSLPQWLQLEWDTSQLIRQVELTFPGHLLREYHAYQPFYRDPQCPADYSLSALVDGEWVHLLNVKENYQRHRRHVLSEPVDATALRITVEATNGDPAAAIYEVRCY
jgi:hypothetical protein